MNSRFCSRLAFVGLVALTGASWGASEVRAQEGGGVPGFTFRVIINTDKSLVVQTTTNSVDWQGLFQVASPGGGFAVLDPATETNFMQFFRAVDPEVPPFVINSSFPDLKAAKWGFNTSRFVDTSVTTNHVLRFGWNAEETDPNQPVWVQRFESDWAAPNGDRLMEWYLTHRDTNGVFVRPIMTTVSRLTQQVRGNLAGNWAFVNSKDPSKQIMIVQEDPVQAIAIGRNPRTNLFEVYNGKNGETMFLGGVARGVPDTVSLNFYAQNGANAPTYARMSLGVYSGAAGLESGSLVFWTRFNGSFGERARLLYNGNFGIGTTDPAFKLDVNGDARIRGTGVLRFGGDNSSLADTAIFRSGAGLLTLGANVIVPTGRYLSVGTPDAGGSEVRIYRSAHDLATVEGALALRRNNSTNLALGVFTITDLQYRLAVMADGGLFFGDGVNVADVALRRSGLRTLSLGTAAASADINVFGTARVRVRGTSAMTAVPGRFSVNTAPFVSSGTLESDLGVVTVPGNSLANQGDALQVRASGSFGPSGGDKTLRLYFGNTLLLTTGAHEFSSATWVVTAEIIRTGPNSQIVNATFMSDSSGLRSTVVVTTAAEDDAASNLLRFTAIGDVDGAVVQRSCTVDWKPAN